MALPSVIQGATRGIGLAMARQLVERGETVIATGRSAATSPELAALAAEHGDRLEAVPLDVSSERSIETALTAIAQRHERIGLLVNAAGLLHDGPLGPEKKLEQLDEQALHRVFAVNAFGPALMLKHAKPLLQHRERAVVANISARVGSITDNGLGGWYGYRASKAAQNMFTKTAAIELGRGSRRVIVIALHPGTVETDLSAPFRGSVPSDKLFSTERAARQLLAIIDGVGDGDTGRFFAWDGSAVPW